MTSGFKDLPRTLNYKAVSDGTKNVGSSKNDNVNSFANRVVSEVLPVGFGQVAEIKTSETFNVTNLLHNFASILYLIRGTLFGK